MWSKMQHCCYLAVSSVTYFCISNSFKYQSSGRKRKRGKKQDEHKAAKKAKAEESKSEDGESKSARMAFYLKLLIIAYFSFLVLR